MKSPIRARALELLDGWDQELRDCYAGKPSHPVFIALRQTIRACEIPIEPFSDLLVAFRQDQTVHRYPTWDGVLGYCRYSANPVGRLVLYLCGYRDAGRQQLSDATCTALQLANFWQDVRRDLEKGRIYIPLEALAAHGLTEDDIVARRFDERYVSLMKELIARTRELFAEGLPLAAACRFRVARGHRNVQPRRTGCAGRDRGHRLQHAAAPAVDPEVETVAVAGARALSAPVCATSGRHAWRLPGRDARRLFEGLLRRANIGKRTRRVAFPAKSRQSYAECRRVAREAASNFYYAFFMLPQAKRDALCALYAFMRLVDDVSDTVGGAADKQRGLARWRAALDAAVAGDVSAHPILPAFADTIERFHIPPRYFHDLISGAEMDLTVGDYATFERLREYCYRVAGTVGLTCLHVFGFDDPHAPDLAEKLGIAFQLTNILRDVPKDYEMGRVYLPQEDLARFGVRAAGACARAADACAARPACVRSRARLELLSRRRGADPARASRCARRAVGAGANL